MDGFGVGRVQWWVVWPDGGVNTGELGSDRMGVNGYRRERRRANERTGETGRVIGTWRVGGLERAEVVGALRPAMLRRCASRPVVGSLA